jgi:hypothetical protein
VSNHPALRALAKVELDDAGCWMFTGCRCKKGYGRISAVPRRMLIAHRVVYEAFLGPIPDGLTIDHLCHNKGCVNPGHLEPVTQAENKRRWGLTVTHCRHGHEFTDDNIDQAWLRLKGWRRCVTCKKQRNSRG